jgi:hypothetical protein
MKKWLIFVLVFFFINISFVNATLLHNSTNIWINVDGILRNLNANLTYFTGIHNYTLPTSLPLGSHNASRIWVSTQDGEMTLFQALQSVNKLCPNPAKPMNYTNPAPNPGHYATEIAISSGASLQESINNGNLCIANTYSWNTGGWTSNNACPTVYTRTFYCQRNDGANMGTTCGIYAGCECPNPVTSFSAVCIWEKNYFDCGCTNINQGSPLCGDIPDCSKEGTSCSPRDASEYCGEGSCSCGSLCSSTTVYTLKCIVNPNPTGFPGGYIL